MGGAFTFKFEVPVHLRMRPRRYLIKFPRLSRKNEITPLHSYFRSPKSFNGRQLWSVKVLPTLRKREGTVIENQEYELDLT